MNQPNDPTNPTNPTNTAWEEAMSRDFDARVRDLHEAPLDFDTVKGKARTIRRNRRAAVAGGVLGVAAVITPIAVVMGGNADTDSDKPPFVDRTPDTSETTVPDPVGSDPEYVVGGVWHQADGDKITLPENDQAYDAAVVWEGQLVATRWGGEVFSVADVIDEDGNVVDSFETTAPVVVNDAGTTIAWVGTDGKVMTRWADDQVAMGEVDLAASGESIAYSAAAITGGPNCYEAQDGCMVYVNGGDGSVLSFDSHGVNDSPLEQYIEVTDVAESGATVTTEIKDAGSCSALVAADGTVVADTCDHQLWQVSPDGQSIAAPPAYFDGLGPSSISIVDTDATQTGTYGVEGGFVGTWAWTTDNRLLFDAYDGAQWHLFAMAADGSVEEIGDPAKGDEIDRPFTLVQH